MSPWLLLALLPAALADPAAFDDGRYVNRAAVRGGLDLGVGWEAPLGWEPDASTGWLLRPVGRGAAWWQTRDLDLAVHAALLPTVPFGAPAARPDALVAMKLDMRPSPAVGVLLDGRVLAESRELAPVERPEPWEPWLVAARSSDLASGALAASARLRPVVDLELGEGTTLELGGGMALDRMRLPDETFADAGQRLGGGPRGGLRLALRPDLALVARGQLEWFSWTGLPTEAGAFSVAPANP